MKSNKQTIKAVATDLDGTILPYGGEFSSNVIETLNHLGAKGIVRIIATGRSLWSAQKVLDPHFPIDYLVFSSGAGIFDWKQQRLIANYTVPIADIENAISVLKRHDLAFTLHRKSPENHLFLYHKGNDPHPNLFDYLDHYHPNGEPISEPIPTIEYSQLLAFLPSNKSFPDISKEISNLKTVRATSPIDDTTIWLECFHPSVSKANGIHKICDSLNINSHEVAAIGNDYNDLDMLRAFSNCAVVDNAPPELKQEFTNVPNVQENGFSYFIDKVIGIQETKSEEIKI